MELHYHVGHLTDYFDSNQRSHQIRIHLNAIMRKYENGELDINKSNEKIFKKIIQGMLKYSGGYWEKENWQYKILFYALKGLLNQK